MSTYHKVRLGITHEEGDLTISKNKLVWKQRSPGKLVHEIVGSEIKNIEWLNIDRRRKLMRLTFTDKSKKWIRFIGFGNDDEVEIDKICKKNLGKGLIPKKINLSGSTWGKFVLRGQDMVCRTNKKHILFTIPYNIISQSVIQAKNEISLEFKTNNNNRNIKTGDQLCEMRIFIPDDDDDDDNNNNNNNQAAAYEEFNETLMKKAKLESDKSTIITWFKNITFRVPRGNKEIYFYPSHFQFRTETFAYRVKYKQIKRLFVFEQPGEKVAFLVHLSPGIRQGYQTYGYLIMEFPEDQICTTTINASSDELRSKYASKDGVEILKKEMTGPTYDVLSRVFMALSKIKIIAARKFKSVNGYKCIKCSSGANQGLLYPLEKSIFFIWKPVTYIRHADIQYIEILRMDQSHNIKMFDLSIKYYKKDVAIVFTGINRVEYENLMRYFLKKPNINILNKQLHESRLNNTMKSSSRSTRTRKHIKASTLNITIDNNNDLDDDEDDEDYNMADDQDMLDEDDQDDDRHFDRITKAKQNKDNDNNNDDDEDDDLKNNNNNNNNNTDMIDEDEDDDL